MALRAVTAAAETPAPASGRRSRSGAILAPALTLVHGGLRRPEIIVVERRTVDELRVDNRVHQAERRAFAHLVRHHALWAAHGVATGVGDPGRHLTALLRLAAREEARLAAADDLDPVSEASVAA